MKRILTSLFAAIIAFSAAAQSIVWHNPVDAGFPVIQGQGWQGEARENPYHRFPAFAKPLVRDAVWGLSTDTAGEALRFRTDTDELFVRYGVSGSFAMHHMPATGVSGVDIYTYDQNGGERWLAGQMRFADTCSYTYRGIDFEPEKAHDYIMYLPLYNGVTWLEVGVPEGKKFEWLPLRREKPIVAYGTSIAHGACASRTGMAWTNILQRRFDTPVINLGFSGNAKFDAAVIDLLGQCDASIYLIDAMPNSYSMPVEMLKDTCYKAMRRLREARPETPILMIDHLGYPHGSTITERKQIADRGNAAQHEVYEQLIAEGMNDLYYLSYDEIALPQDATVEGVHPSDYGMVVLADKYEAKIREILNLPVGGTSTTTPITQNRDPYEWQDRHQKILAETQGKHYPAVIVGNSIVHFWSGDESNRGNGKQVWDKYLSDALNLGYGWDRIENTLWRVYHGEFEGYTADRIYVMLGTNNLASNSDDEIVEGLQNLWSQIAFRRPEADLVVVGILPRRNTEGRIKNLNKRLQGAAKAAGYRFADPGANLLDKKGKIVESYFTDGLHPNNDGYARIVETFTK